MSRLHSPMQSHQSSFFNQLPYVIRAIIYENLEPDHLPPLAPRFKNLGFLLSCRQAKQELEEVAYERLGRFLRDFKRTTAIQAEIQHEDDDLRCITVQLPYTAFGKSGWATERLRLMWKREVLSGLHQLFVQYFNVVRIHIVGNSRPTTHTKARHAIRSRPQRSLDALSIARYILHDTARQCVSEAARYWNWQFHARHAVCI